MMTVLRKNRWLRPHGKESFLLKMYSKHIRSKQYPRLLDVGCGNNSVRSVRHYLPDCYYIGIDIGDYNLRPELKELMNEYHVVSSQEFPDKIFQLKDSVDIVISSHNIEHCDEPEKVLKAMAAALKHNGEMYMSFPCEESVNFPHRYGTLNFYDDETHQKLPEWNKILAALKEYDVDIVYKNKNYKPFLDSIQGKINEKKSIKEQRILGGTWAYWGFESIIWGKKK